MNKKQKIIFSFFFFWAFLLLFKFGGGLHYALIAPLGERFLPLWIVGTLMSFASILQLVLDIPAGNILDKFGYRKVLTIGTFTFIIACLLLLLGENALSLILSVLLATIGWLFFGPGKNAYILSHADKKYSSEFMVYRDIACSIGIVLSCIALPFFVNSTYADVGLISAIIIGLATLTIILSPKDTKKITPRTELHEKTHHQRKLVLKNFFSIIKKLNPASAMLILLSFVGATFYGTIWFVVPLIIANSPENAGILGIGLSMFDFSIVVTGAFLNVLVRKTNKKRLIFLGLLLFALAGILLGYSYGLPFLLFAFIATMGNEMAELPLWVWLHSLDKKHNKDGLISGIINLFEDLGWALGPLIAGILYVIVGPTITIIIGATPILILLIIYQLSVRKHIIKVNILEAPRKPHRARHKG